jgi:predicted ATP-grasp superfamily ATP-dependent carboligase
LDCLPGIQTARILAENGVSVIGIARDPNHPFAHTNTCKTIQFSAVAQDELMLTLEGVGAQLEQKAVLYPCTDYSVLLVSRNRRVLQERYHIALPEPETLEMLMDKVSFSSFAQQHRLPVPATFFLRTRDEAIVCSEQVPFPCIMKPAFKTPNWERNAAGAKQKSSSRPTNGVVLGRNRLWPRNGSTGRIQTYTPAIATSTRARSLSLRLWLANFGKTRPFSA